MTATEGDFLELIVAAQALSGVGQDKEAAGLYQSWMDQNPCHPSLFAAQFNCGILWQRLGDLARAVDCFEAAIRLKPDFLAPYINLGHLCEQAGDRLRAAAVWQSGVDQPASCSREAIDYKLDLLKRLARLLASVFLDEEAERALGLSLTLDPHQGETARHWLNIRMSRLQWPLLAPLPPQRHRWMLEQIAPLLLACLSDDPLWQLANAAFAARRAIGPDSPADPPARQDLRPGERLRIGYLSADLWEHATSYLTADLFGQHDRAAFEIFLYNTGEPRGEGLQQRLRSSAEHWRDLNPLDSEDAATQIAHDGVHILVDLNGHARGAHFALLARRPAPVIVNWLGFPGSTGSPLHHYIIADPFIIPSESEVYYSERVLRLPCYQPTDRHRSVAATRPSRAEAGLPEEAMVFCSLNEPRKITETTWRRWTRILTELAGSVLWLLIGAETTQAHLRRLADAQGIDPARLIFAPRLRNPGHLARYPLADLALDSFPCGSHTTASDALWMGVPVLSLPGRSFASRVCGSLVTAAGLPEMVCASEEEYIAKAVALGSAPAARAALREKLARNRDSCLLFDTPHLTAELERLYRRMWAEYAAGDLPRPDLANMELYRDVGIDMALEGVEPDAYEEAVRRAIARRRVHDLAGPDQRFCQD